MNNQSINFFFDGTVTVRQYVDGIEKKKVSFFDDQIKETKESTFTKWNGQAERD